MSSIFHPLHQYRNWWFGCWKYWVCEQFCFLFTFLIIQRNYRDLTSVIINVHCKLKFIPSPELCRFEQMNMTYLLCFYLLLYYYYYCVGLKSALYVNVMIRCVNLYVCSASIFSNHVCLCVCVCVPHIPDFTSYVRALS